MVGTARRWCLWCTLLGVALFLWGANAWAQSGGADSPTYADWFKIVVGLLIALVGAYAKGIDSRVTKLEVRVDSSATRITDLREILVGEYHDKDAIDKRFDRVDQSISALHRRLDFLRVPNVPPGSAGYHHEV
jgi:hypothetical protein